MAGSEFVAEADIVIAAIGQAPEASALLAGNTNLEVTRFGNLAVEPDTLSTNIPGIFAGGDCITGPDTVIGAIAAGKKAAAAIDRYLGGDGVITEPLAVKRCISGIIIEEEAPRQETVIVDGVDVGYTRAQALAEAMRCLRCDVAD